MPVDATRLRTDLEAKARQVGIDVLGVADITCLYEYLCPRGGEFLRDFPRAISIGVRYPDGAIDQLFQHHTLSSQWTYRYYLFSRVVHTLDMGVMVLSRGIEDGGYRSHPIYTNDIDDGKVRWAYPLKLTGYLAGLGWIGKSSLLINPKFGPRFRLSVVLTDAPLAVDSPLPVRCGRCTDCLNICPPNVLAGYNMDPRQPREDWSHGKACKAYVNQRAIDLPLPDSKGSCGLCVYICPFGKGKKRSSQGKKVQRAV